MSQPLPAEAGVYVYCVAHAAPFRDGDAEFQSTGIGGRGDAVRLVEWEDLVAVVSDSPKARYELRREYLMAHEHVVEEAMQRSDVLPVAFSTVAGKESDVRDLLLRKRFDELHAHLVDVRDRVELGLKVLWNEERLFAEVVMENDDIRGLQQSIAGTPEDASYYDRIQLGQLTEQAISSKNDDEAEAVLTVLEPLAVATQVNKNFMERMFLNAAFLVDKSREADFDEQVRVLGESNAGRLIFQYVGPLPPYNFVTIKVRWEE
jgi:Gas vesicle synthesis protein GvpL/GvpF